MLKIGQNWGKIANYPPNAQQRFAPLLFGFHGSMVFTYVGTISKSCSSCAYFISFACSACSATFPEKLDESSRWLGAKVSLHVAPHTTHFPILQRKLSFHLAFPIWARHTLRFQNCRNTGRLQCSLNQVVDVWMSGESSSSLFTAETMHFAGIPLV